MEIRRTTSKGELVLTVVAGNFVAHLNNEVVGRTLDKLPAAQKGPAGDITHRVGACAVYAHEAEQIEKACKLFRIREAIVLRIQPGAFPGSKEAVESSRAEKMLAEFDATNPRIAEEARAASDALRAPANSWM